MADRPIQIIAHYLCLAIHTQTLNRDRTTTVQSVAFLHTNSHIKAITDKLKVKLWEIPTDHFDLMRSWTDITPSSPQHVVSKCKLSWFVLHIFYLLLVSLFFINLVLFRNRGAELWGTSVDLNWTADLDLLGITAKIYLSELNLNTLVHKSFLSPSCKSIEELPAVNPSEQQGPPVNTSSP